MSAVEYADKRYSDSYDGITRVAYENLSNSIIVQAAHDYVTYAVHIQKMKWHNVKRDYHNTLEYYQRELTSIKQFFFSQWFRFLTHVDPILVWQEVELQTSEAIEQARYNFEMRQKKKEAINHESKETQREGYKGTQQFNNSHRLRKRVLA